MKRGQRGSGATVTAILALSVAACGSGTATTPGTGASAITGPITVFAAASLTESFTQIGKDFEAANPGTSVTFNFSGSSGLATQINEGAPADGFAAASPATMKTVIDAGNGVGTPVVFVKNQLVIAVPKGNPEGITGLADLARADLKVALCAEQVPCGTAAKKALATAGVAITPVTLEQDVKAALSKVTLGEVDAALVYRTDVRSDASHVDGLEFPESASAINDYQISVLRDAPNSDGAETFVAYVTTGPGQTVLTDVGFQSP